MISRTEPPMGSSSNGSLSSAAKPLHVASSASDAPAPAADNPFPEKSKSDGTPLYIASDIDILSAPVTMPKRTNTYASAGTIRKKQKNTAQSPVDVLKELFASRKNASPRNGKFEKPRKEDIDAYDLQVVKAIRSGNMDELQRFHKEGVSLNACNQFGESLLHMACRRGDLAIVKYLVETARVRIEIRDDFGRTPMHDACWTSEPQIEIMRVLMAAAPTQMLLVEDVRGHTPFDYSRRQHWSRWIEFLKQNQQQILDSLSEPKAEAN